MRRAGILNFGQPKKTEGLPRQKIFWPGPGVIKADLLGKRTTFATNEASLEGRGFNNGQKNPTAIQER